MKDYKEKYNRIANSNYPKKKSIIICGPESSSAELIAIGIAETHKRSKFEDGKKLVHRLKTAKDNEVTSLFLEYDLLVVKDCKAKWIWELCYKLHNWPRFNYWTGKESYGSYYTLNLAFCTRDDTENFESNNLFHVIRTSLVSDN